MYLYGTNLLEKLNRIDRIAKKEIPSQYNFSFLKDKQLNLGHLLIYGISFAEIGFKDEIRPEILNTAPLIKTIDEHILLRLECMFEQERIEKITLAYYSNADLQNYRKNIYDKKFKDIVEYKQCKEVFDFL